MPDSYRILETPFGWAAFVAGPHGLKRIYLPQKSLSALRAQIRHEHAGAAEDAALLPELADALAAYFDGRPATFDVPIDWGDAGTFMRRVWAACRRIPYGMTVSYGELAGKIGKPGAARAVGMAMAHNPVPIVVPCHRVLRGDGGLGGFSAHDGVSLKRRLLALEQQVSRAPCEGAATGRASRTSARSARPGTRRRRVRSSSRPVAGPARN